MTTAYLWMTIFVTCFTCLNSAKVGIKQNVTIASFNIENLGCRKVNKEIVVDDLKKIIYHYDIMLVEELQDKTGEAIKILKDCLNRNRPPTEWYEVVVGDRVGRRPGEVEQYAIFYKPAIATLLKSYTYNDLSDVFSREPLVAEMKFVHGNLPAIGFVVIHTKPDMSMKRLTAQEIDALADVYDTITNQDEIQNVLLMGDFNAGGRYVTWSDWSNIRLRTRPEFKWLIDDDADTTVRKTTAAYDRIVVAGKDLQHAIINHHVYRYNEDASIKGRKMTLKEALAISDHFPVDVTVDLIPKK